ncbi:hypothetical protein DXG03_007939 [Asterophora parasitica]|uniref:alpha-1,2-Mannosidase n=1 Tax=Asterophora parasitica TaxID=117018 RepID=A0A9P7KED4_9AGAR|nr:hypothetical protein DXG03_007939 [Asterophora parasitica]
MGLDGYFAEAVDFVANKIDFSKSQTPDAVSVFETTIRYLGGLLSAYELSDQKYPALLKKATQVADKIAFAWVGVNDVPFGYLNFTTNKPKIATSNIAEAGTLTLEWATLSKYTGNDTYRQLTEKSVRRVASQVAPLPGLPAQGIDPSSGTPVGGYVTWGGGSDSYFEYLIKYARLANTADPFFVNKWSLAVDSSIRTLLRTSTVGNHVYLADYDSSKKILHVGSHLACFYGGNWLFGGRLLNNQTIVKIGLDLVDACWNTYASTATGIGPEAFAFISDDGDYTGGVKPTADNLRFNAEHGFYITSSAYILRPEVLESNFMAWRVTGDTKYLDRAQSAIESFNKFLSVNGAYAGLWDVNNVNSARINDMESFWFAEVLKYLFVATQPFEQSRAYLTTLVIRYRYLTFDDPEHISLDKYVFNTEAHPLKAPAPKESYGSGRLPSPTSNGQAFQVTDGEVPEVSQGRGILSL